MSILTFIEQAAMRLRHEQESAPGRGLDKPVEVQSLRLRATVGTLCLYECLMPADVWLQEDVPVSLIPPDGGESTEGIVLAQDGALLHLQLVDSVGPAHATATIVPDASAFLEAAARRLSDIVAKSQVYTLGPAERLSGLLTANPEQIIEVSRSTPSAVLTTIWGEGREARRTRLATLLLELIRHNKRVLLLSPDHHGADETLGAVARNLKAAGLPYKSHVTRYELALADVAQGVSLQELGFEAQMHQFFAKSRADKAALRRKYERFRELTPILAYKAQKQQELDEVKLLEWRLMTQLTDLRAKIAEIDTITANYEALPIWKRLAMQSVGKNVASLAEYRALYDQQVEQLLTELDIAKARIGELSPEAAIPRDMRPEYDELKEEVVRLGGTKKIREMLAAEEGTNRQAFLQNRRLVVATAARVMTDPLFGKVRFDVLVVDEAPWMPAAFVAAAAALVRERIVLSGEVLDFSATRSWDAEHRAPIWRPLRERPTTVG